MATPAPATASGGPMTVDAKKALLSKWLNHTYLTHAGDDGVTIDLGIKEFSNITNLSPETCWMTSDMIDPVISLLTLALEKSEVLVLTTAISQGLYTIGMDRGQLANFDGLWTGNENGKELLLSERRRWIIVPCSNGVIQVYDRQKGCEKHSADAAAGANSTTSKSTKELAGSHWGLLVIDTKEKIARYVDSMVTAVRTPERRWRIEEMPNVGIAAGKILRGLELVLNKDNVAFNAREYTASTLKHTPNQNRHNDGGKDGGACGPFIFKALEAIYKMMGPGNEDIKAMFTSSMRDTRRFNSVVVRKEMQNLIEERAEASKPQTAPVGHNDRTAFVWNLSSQLIKLLYTPEELYKAMENAHRQLGRTDQPPASVTAAGKPSNPGKISQKQLDGYILEVKVDMENRLGEYTTGMSDEEARNIWMAFQDCDHPADDYDLLAQSVDFLPIGEADINQWMNTRPSGDDLTIDQELWTKKAGLQKLFGGTDDENGIAALEKTQLALWRDAWPEMNKTLGAEAIRSILEERTNTMAFKNRRGRWRFYPQYYHKKQGGKLSSSGTQPLDHARMTVEDLQPRLEEAKEFPRHTDTANDFSYRAVLFINDKKSFKNKVHASTVDLETLWIQDGNVFEEAVDYNRNEKKEIVLLNDCDHRLIQKRMIQFYHRDESSGDEPDAVRLGYSDSLKGPEKTGKKRSHNNDNQTNRPSKKAKMTVPDFRTLEEDNLVPWINQFPERYQAQVLDSNGVIIDEPRARAWLQRAYHNTFQTLETESQSEYGLTKPSKAVDGTREDCTQEILGIEAVGAFNDSSKIPQEEAGDEEEDSEGHDDDDESDEDSAPSDHSSDDHIGSASPSASSVSSSVSSDHPDDGGRKGKSSGQDDTEPSSKKQKTIPSSFFDMNMNDLLLWIDQLPQKLRDLIQDSNGKLRNTEEVRARSWLQRVYHDTFTDYDPVKNREEILKWRDKWEHCLGAKLSKRSPLGILTWRLRETSFEKLINGKKTRYGFIIPDYRGDKSKVPDAWKEKNTTETDEAAEETSEERVQRKQAGKDEKKKEKREAAKLKLREDTKKERLRARRMEKRKNIDARKEAKRAKREEAKRLEDQAAKRVEEEKKQAAKPVEGHSSGIVDLTTEETTNSNREEGDEASGDEENRGETGNTSQCNGSGACQGGTSAQKPIRISSGSEDKPESLNIDNRTNDED